MRCVIVMLAGWVRGVVEKAGGGWGVGEHARGQGLRCLVQDKHHHHCKRHGHTPARQAEGIA